MSETNGLVTSEELAAAVATLQRCGLRINEVAVRPTKRRVRPPVVISSVQVEQLAHLLSSEHRVVVTRLHRADHDTVKLWTWTGYQGAIAHGHRRMQALHAVQMLVSPGGGVKKRVDKSL